MARESNDNAKAPKPEFHRAYRGLEHETTGFLARGHLNLGDLERHLHHFDTSEPFPTPHEQTATIARPFRIFCTPHIIIPMPASAAEVAGFAPGSAGTLF